MQSDSGHPQKNPFSVRKVFVRNSGAGNGCANFMDAWKNAFFLQEKTHVHIKFLVLGGGGILGFFFWGGSADFIFMGARIFLTPLFPALCSRVLGTRFRNYGSRMFWGELMVI